MGSSVAQSDLEEDTISYTKFGIGIEDHFLWLEELDNIRTQEWLADQTEQTKTLLGKGSRSKLKKWLQVRPQDDIINKGRLQFNYEKFDNKPGILKYREGNQGIFIPLVNCKNYRNNEHDIPDIESFWMTSEGKYVVVALSHSGNDWLEYVVVEISSRKKMEVLKGITKPWLMFKDDGFLYQHHEVPENVITGDLIDQKLNYHKFNTSQAEDFVVFRNADRTGTRSFHIFQHNNSPSYFYVQYPFKMNGGWKYAISKMELWKDLILPKPFLVYESDYDVTFQAIYEEESQIYFRTNLNAGNYCLIKCNVDSLNNYTVVHPEYKEVMTNAVYLGSGTIGITYLSDGKYSGMLKKGSERKVISVPVGANIEFERGQNENKAYFSLNTHYLLPMYFEVDLRAMSYKLVSTQRTSRSKYVVKVLPYKVVDGQVLTMLFISYDSSLNGRGPTIMHVYGGYGSINTPTLTLENDFFLLNGGVLAFPAVRGGGALGTQGELEGKGRNKQNGISDVIDAADYLVQNEYSTKENLFIEGHSHGGFLVTAAAIQRPDLFRGVFAYSGAYDLIREENFATRSMYTNLVEYGDPSDSIDFQYMHKISPIHQLKKGVAYPSFFLLAGKNDSRVPASNSLRFKALLDAYSTNKYNLLEVTNGGHGVINYRSQMLEIISMKFQFIYQLTGHKSWKYFRN